MTDQGTVKSAVLTVQAPLRLLPVHILMVARAWCPDGAGVPSIPATNRTAPDGMFSAPTGHSVGALRKGISLLTIDSVALAVRSSRVKFIDSSVEAPVFVILIIAKGSPPQSCPLSKTAVKSGGETDVAVGSGSCGGAITGRLDISPVTTVVWFQTQHLLFRRLGF